MSPASTERQINLAFLASSDIKLQIHTFLQIHFYEMKSSYFISVADTDYVFFFWALLLWDVCEKKFLCRLLEETEIHWSTTPGSKEGNANLKCHQFGGPKNRRGKSFFLLVRLLWWQSGNFFFCEMAHLLIIWHSYLFLEFSYIISCVFPREKFCHEFFRVFT